MAIYAISRKLVNCYMSYLNYQVDDNKIMWYAMKNLIIIGFVINKWTKPNRNYKPTNPK